MAQLTRWQPVHDIDALLDDLERRWTSGFRRILEHGDSVQSVPACEILEGDHDTLMRFDIPGVDPERDLEITVEGDMFCVRGERRHDGTVDSVPTQLCRAVVRAIRALPQAARGYRARPSPGPLRPGCARCGAPQSPRRREEACPGRSSRGAIRL